MFQFTLDQGLMVIRAAVGGGARDVGRKWENKEEGWRTDG